MMYETYPTGINFDTRILGYKNEKFISVPLNNLPALQSKEAKIK